MDIEKSVNKSFEGKVDDDGNAKISLLLNAMPVLDDLFYIHYKVGEGTFSSVFLATLKNTTQSRNFAVKHLVPTCHPGRIERELQCLKDIGGKDHVVGLELCLRNGGSVAFVMPFMRHDRFSDYVLNMGSDEMKQYMKALLTAVARVHKFNIIHRDIKPSNFLYDRKNRRYLLVDFGLAQQYIKNEKPRDYYSKAQVTNIVKWKKSDDENKQMDKTLKNTRKQVTNKCCCFGKPKICSICLVKPLQNAPRAGTPGFRAPEVLLKHAYQTPAIDIWACGVIMLSILSGTQPFFRSPDDMTALAEITTVFGSTAIQQCAKKIGKKFICSNNTPAIDLTSLCQKLQKRNKISKIIVKNVDEDPGSKYPVEAYQLLIRLLDLDYKTRITAEQALLHPFFEN
ncbi:cell division cycle 7-related protein kinase-like [Phymastichus coffea]|uniref:cell division cycle 7-related protein kinase-like n=1 Tax=Phymastichus coffea TaxID=108790 RepID=UPI00273B4E8C|nr:cell division cycle 7-related protein kinase-like [Phymastichus coffea]